MGTISLIVILTVIALLLRAVVRRVDSEAAPLARMTRAPIPAGAVMPDATSVLQQRGWKQSGNEYHGPFATPFGTWHGRLEAAGDTFRCYIKNPPMDIIGLHPKWPCFSQTSTHHWWRINLQRSPVDRDPSAIVLHIERILTEAHRLAGKT